MRDEPLTGAFAPLHAITALWRMEFAPEIAEIGTAITHARLAEVLAGVPELALLATVITSAANHGVRRAATLGGNRRAVDFLAADLACALLALDADIDLERLSGLTAVCCRKPEGVGFCWRLSPQ